MLRRIFINNSTIYINYSDMFYLFTGKKIKHIRIIDVNGRIINEYAPKHTNSIKLNTNNLENGVYLIQITTTDNKVLRNKRIVVAKYY